MSLQVTQNQTFHSYWLKKEQQFYDTIQVTLRGKQFRPQQRDHKTWILKYTQPCNTRNFTEIQTGGYLWRSFFLILPSEHDQLDGAQDLGQLRLTCWFFFLFLSNCDMWCCSLCLLPLILSFCTSVFSVHSHKVVEKKNHKKP